MGAVLGFLGILAVLVGLGATANDGISGLRIRTRKQGAVILGVGLLVVVVAAALFLLKPANS